MSRWLFGSLAFVLACPARAPHESRVHEAGTHEARTHEDEPEPPAGSSVGLEPNPETRPNPDGSSSHDCEQLCGQLHDCLLVEPGRPPADPRQVAALELDCLQLCIEGPTLADSRFATCAELDDCGEFGPCMRAAWPVTAEEPVEPVIEPSGSDGCQLGCKRLGECFASSTDEVDECARGCEQRLDASQQTAFGECMEIADCLAMLECMRAFPGA